MDNTNGQSQNDLTNISDMSVVSDILQEEVSVGYKPVMPLESMWLSGGDMPTVTLRRDLEFMQMHPVVCTALEYYKSGIAGAEFWGGPDQANPDNIKGKPISPDQRVSQFVLAHVERFWQRGVPILQEGGYPYGWAPGEHIYKESMGMLVWSHLKGFHPNDGFILTLRHQPIGIRVKNIRDAIGATPSGGLIDLWFASDNIPAKAAWYPHRPRFNHFYGRSQLTAAWRPWRRLAWRDAVEQVIDAAIYRGGYSGMIIKHPKEDAQTALSGVPATQADGRGMSRRGARDVARQMCEWAKAGASFTMSSENYPQAMGGGPKWDAIRPEHVMDVTPLIKAAQYLEDQIMLGIGVPPELVKAGGTGSGYSGRSIPREAFLDQQQRVADSMLQIFVEQVVKPLVLWNFGDIPFEISCKPLLKSQVENKQGQPQPPLPQPAEDGQGGQPPGAPGQEPPPNDQPPQGQAMSLNPSARVLDIVRRVIAKENEVHLSTDAGGREHKGKGKGGGQFTKGSSGSDDKQKSKKKPEKEDTPEWDGIINRSNIGSFGDTEHIARWDFYDEEGNHFPQTVQLQTAAYDTDPNGTDPDSVIDIFRWVSSDDGGITDQGKWTIDQQKAISEGQEYARDSDQDAPEDEDEDEDSNKSEKDTLNHYLDGDEKNAAYVVGAPSDATVRVDIDSDDFSVSVSIRHPFIDTCRRTLDTDKHGRKFIHNDILEIKKDKQGGGFASELFSRQAQQAAESGYAYIETHAAGRWSNRRSWNGYYTWPCLGYDQSLDDLAAQDSDGRNCAQMVRQLFPEAESVLDVVQTSKVELDEYDAQYVRDELTKLDVELRRPLKDRPVITGLMWWQIHGEDLEHAKFDLKEGSRSWEQNEAYRQSKKK